MRTLERALLRYLCSHRRPEATTLQALGEIRSKQAVIAVQCGDRRDIERMETQAIRTLQPPTQCSPYGCGVSSRQRPTRPWVRTRHPFDAQKECELNLWRQRKPTDWAQRAPLLWGSWEEFAFWAKQRWQLTEPQAIARAFTRSEGAIGLLAVHRLLESPVKHCSIDCSNGSCSHA